MGTAGRHAIQTRGVVTHDFRERHGLAARLVGLAKVRLACNCSTTRARRPSSGRLAEPEKNWNFSVADVRERQFLKPTSAYEDMILAAHDCDGRRHR